MTKLARILEHRHHDILLLSLSIHRYIALDLINFGFSSQHLVNGMNESDLLNSLLFL
jgi:hypothetical protein